MAKDGDYGHGKYTRIKNEHFRGLLMMHMAMSKKFASQQCPYQYLDLNAGPGRYYPGQETPTLWDAWEPADAVEIKGSPIIFLECAAARQVTYRAVFFEQDARFRERLTGLVGSDPAVTVTGSHAEAVNWVCKCAGCHRKARGMIYSDETGHIPPFELLADLSHHGHLLKTDILVNYSATAHKRARAKYGGSDLLAYLRDIEKSDWLIREPLGQHQWTLLLGTNWADYPAWRRVGFHNVRTPEGQTVVRRLNYTTDELAAVTTPPPEGGGFSGYVCPNGLR